MKIETNFLSYWRDVDYYLAKRGLGKALFSEVDRCFRLVLSAPDAAQVIQMRFRS